MSLATNRGSPLSSVTTRIGLASNWNGMTLELDTICSLSVMARRHIFHIMAACHAGQAKYSGTKPALNYGTKPVVEGMGLAGRRDGGGLPSRMGRWRLRHAQAEPIPPTLPQQIIRSPASAGLFFPLQSTTPAPILPSRGSCSHGHHSNRHPDPGSDHCHG